MLILPSFKGLSHAEVAKIMYSNCGWADDGKGAPEESSVLLCMLVCGASLYLGGLASKRTLDFFKN